MPRTHFPFIGITPARKSFLLSLPSEKIMKKSLLLLIVFCMSVAAQQIQVLDAVTAAPLPHVKISSGNVSLYTNDAGMAEISRLSCSDSLFITHIAYHTQVMNYRELTDATEVKLVPDTLSLESVTVTGSLPVQSLERTEIAVQPMEMMRYQSVADILRDFSSLYIKDYGGYSGAKLISSRGLGSENSIVFFNEMRVNDIRSGFFDFSSLGSGAVDKIEILTGFDPETNATSPGSLIKLSSGELTDSFRLRAGLKRGSSGLSSFSASVKNGDDNLAYGVSGERSYATNDYPFAYRGKQFNRKNAHFNRSFANAHLTYKSTQNLTKLYAHYSLLHNGVPGFVVENNTASSRAENRAEAILAVASNEWAPANTWSIKSTVGYHRQSLFMTDPDGIVFLDKISSESNVDEFSISVQARKLVGDLRLTAGYDYTYSYVDQLGFLVSTGNQTGSIVRRTHKGSLSGTYQFSDPIGIFQSSSLSAAWSLSAVRGDIGFHESIDAPSYFAAFHGVFSFLPQVGMSLQYSNDRRIPTLNERYFSGLFTVSSLQPEQYSGASLTFASVPGVGWLRWAVTGFTILATDKIVWTPSRLAMQVPRNIAKVESYGAECNLSADLLHDHLTIRGSYQLTNATNISNPAAWDKTYGKQLVYTPRHRWNAGADIRISLFTLSLTGSFSDKRYYTADNNPLYVLPSHFVLDASITAQFSAFGVQHHMGISGFNITSEDYYIIQSYPMPQATYLLTYSLELQ